MNRNISAFREIGRSFQHLTPTLVLPVLLATLLMTSWVTAQGITNGGFELPGGVPSGGYILLESGDTRLTGWTVGGTGRYFGLVNGLLPQGGVDFPPAEGTYHITFNGGDNPAGMFIRQTFDTSIGQTYVVTFHVGRCGSGSGVVSLQASVRSEDGQMLNSLTATPPAHGYGEQQRLTFTATSSRSTLEFLDTSPSTIAVDLALDAIFVAPSAASDCLIPPSGLVGFWQGNGNYVDLAGTTNGTAIGGMTFGQGAVGQAFLLDGNWDRVSLGNPTALQLQDFTIEAWIKRSSSTVLTFDNPYGTGEAEVFGYGQGGYCLGVLPNGRLFLTRVGISNVQMDSGGVTDTNWHHVAVTKTGSAVVFYVDGAAYPVGTSFTSVFTFTTPVAIGSRGDGVGATFYGAIDEVSVYNRPLSVAEVQAIYFAGSAGKCTTSPTQCVPPPSGLVHWWQGGGNANDAAGSAQGTLENGARLAPAKVGNGFVFDGVDDAVSFGNSAGNFGARDFTIEFWMRTSSTNYVVSVLEKWPTCGHASKFNIRMNGPMVGNGRLNMQMEQDAGGQNWISLVSAKAVNDGVFHHVAVVRQATNVTFFIDGSFDSAGTTAGITYVSNAVNLVAGRSVCVGVDGTTCFKGELDEIALYDRALSAGEVASLHAAGSAGKCSASNPPTSVVFNAAVDFSTNANPNGLWSYGYTTNLGGNLILHRMRGYDNGLDIWLTDLWLGVPHVAHNGTVATVTNSTGSVVLQPGQLSCHPGPSGEYGVIRFTVPGDGWYQIATAFAGADTHGTTSDVFLMQNGSVFFGGLVNGFGPGSGPTFATNLTLRAGDHLDFAVGRGSNQEFSFDSTSISVVVSSTNLPTAHSPVIVTQPQGRIVDAGSNVTFTVTATGAAPLKYQWHFNHAPLAGATASALALTNVQPSRAGQYFVVVSNAYGVATSSNAALTVLTYPPAITLQPKSVAVYQGRPVSFTSAASGTAPLACQWLFNGAALPGQTATALNLANVQANNAGTYRLVVTNAYGSATSSNALLTVLPPPVCVSAPTGAVAWWRAETNTLDSIGINDAMFNYQLPVTASFTAGKVGGAFRVSAGYLSCPASDELNVGVGEGFSVEGWIRPDSVSGYRPVVEWNDGRGNVGAALAVNGGYLEASFTDTNTLPTRRVTLRSPATVVTNAIWTHVAMTFHKESGIAQVFVNGASLAKTNLGTFNPLTKTAVFLGYRPMYGYYFYGALDEFTLYNRALSTAEIQAIVGADEAGKCVPPPPVCAPPSPDLVAWWRGESNVLDSVSINHGVVTGAVTYTTGAVNRALQFSGGFVRMPATDALNVGAGAGLTIEAWVRPSSSSSLPLVHWNNGTTSGVGLSSYSIGALRANIVDSLGNSHFVISPQNLLASGSFQHVALTYDQASGLAALYVRGSLVTQTNLGSFTPRTTYDLYVGAQPPSSTRFLGMLDEVSLYRRALTAAEIRDIVKARGAGKCMEPPVIVGHPLGLRVAEGGTASFNVIAAGNPLLRYQWFKEGMTLPGKTGTSLVLSNIQPAQAGAYRVLVTNQFGGVFSSNAVLSVGLLPSVVRVVNTTGSAAGTVSVPVALVANGGENGLSFSLNFNTSHLAYASVALGGGAPGGWLQVNANQADSGKLGVILILPAGDTFAVGTQEVVRVNFTAATLTNTATSSISFGNQPLVRQVSDALGNTLPAEFVSGTVTIEAASFEGDVSPRPGGNKAVTVTDWVMVGRYVARLDSPTNASEFQRADCAPRATLGDGVVTVTDWVQAGRYAALLDPLTPAGGPSAANSGSKAPQYGPMPDAANGPAVRLLRLEDAVLAKGQTARVNVNLEAQGNETALGFSLAFDPAALSFVNATLGGEATGASLNVNADQAAAGKLGVALMLPGGKSFGAGTRTVVEVVFRASEAALGDYEIAFLDQPVPREVSDTAASPLPAEYVASTLWVNPLPALKISRLAEEITLSWPLWATNFTLQAAEGASPASCNWTNLSIAPAGGSGENVVKLPMSSEAKFYRLIQP